MLVMLTTIDGPALLNLTDAHAIVPYVDENLTQSGGSDIWWKDGVPDPVGSGLGDRARITFVEEGLGEIRRLLAGGEPE